MSNMVRLLIIVGLIACGIAVVALGFARNDTNLLAPVHLMLFVLAAVVYLLPTGLAMYRDCKATVWIAVVNVLLGWTIFGWFASLGWAAAGKMRTPSAAIEPPPAHPVSGH
jgi:magnesium-transporting ATPase (P-type)